MTLTWHPIATAPRDEQVWLRGSGARPLIWEWEPDNNRWQRGNGIHWAEGEYGPQEWAAVEQPAPPPAQASAPVVPDDLRALSEKATPGEWYFITVICNDYGKPSRRETNIFRKEGIYGHPATCVREIDATFIVALVNAFRAGTLIARDVTPTQVVSEPGPPSPARSSSMTAATWGGKRAAAARAAAKQADLPTPPYYEASAIRARRIRQAEDDILAKADAIRARRVAEIDAQALTSASGGSDATGGEW